MSARTLNKPSGRAARAGHVEAWTGGWRRYDLVKEFVIAFVVVSLLTVALAVVFSSPDDKPVTIARWAGAERPSPRPGPEPIRVGVAITANRLDRRVHQGAGPGDLHQRPADAATRRLRPRPDHAVGAAAPGSGRWLGRRAPGHQPVLPDRLHQTHPVHLGGQLLRGPSRWQAPAR